jgi:hypothetical protein
VGKAKRAHHLFAERPLNIAQIATPIRSEHSLLNEAVEAAVRPVGYALYVAVFHRVEVNVVDVSLEIPVVSNCVFPVPALPDAFLSFGDLAR